MVAPSKLFSRPLKCYHCSQLVLHPGIGCFQHFCNNLLMHNLAGLKYFSPLLLTPLILKYKSMNQELFVHTVKHYLQTVFAASLATASEFACICCLRNLLGDFRICTTLFIPTFLGSQFCWFFPTRVLKLFTTATSQAVLECLLLQYSNKFTNLILHSSIFQTIIFMVNSAIILHYKRKNVYKDFWFIQPHEKLNETKPQSSEHTNIQTGGAEIYYKKCQANCYHTNVSCGKFLLDGIKSYFFYGIPLDLLAMSLTGKLTQGTQGVVPKLMEKFKSFRPYMTGFFTSYIAIYRLSSCLLHKYCNAISLDMQHMLSSFLGGLSFIFVKRINFITLSSVISTQLLWQQFCVARSQKKPNLVLMMLKNASLSQTMFSINCGYLVHNYILNYDLVSTLARGFLDGLTHNKLKKIRNIFINNDLQSLIEKTNAYSVKTFL